MDAIRKETKLLFNNEVSASVSGSSLLSTHIEFKQCEEDSDTLFGNKQLQSKYQVLTATPDQQSNVNNIVRLNGQLKNKHMMNGNVNHVSVTPNESNDGVPRAKVVLYGRDKVMLEWKRCQKIGAGLVNMGNTCFLNSVLQCLTHCPPLVNFLIYNDEEDHQAKCKLLNFCVTCELQKHIKRAYQCSGDAIKPFNICQRLRAIAKHFTFGRQEDAHEFLRYLIDNLWKSCLATHEINNNLKLDAASKETTVINQIFGGYHRSSVTCLQCNETSNTYDYFMDFMLEIKNAMSLEKALELFVRPETLQNENAYKCLRCKRKVPAKKQFTVFQAPNVATFQLKRFDYTRIIGKLTKHVTYPERLNLRPYMSDNKGPPISYKLTGVLVHIGQSCNSGHYFCYVRNSNDFWYCMDDSRVNRVNLNIVLSQQAYLLFYVRIPDHNSNLKNIIPSRSPVIQTHELSRLSQNNNHNGNKLNYQNGVCTPIPNNIMKPASISLNKPCIIKEGIVIKRPATVIINNENKPKWDKVVTSTSASNKGLVPYGSDSSDEENEELNGKIDGKVDKKDKDNCDKSDGSKETSMKVVTTNTTEKIANKSIENYKSSLINSTPNQSVLASNNMKINGNVNYPLSLNTTMTPISITKVKATASSWHVSENTLRSPSVASNSSTNSNSLGSTTEWSIADVNKDSKPSNAIQYSLPKLNFKNKLNKVNETNSISTNVISLPQHSNHNDNKLNREVNSGKSIADNNGKVNCNVEVKVNAEEKRRSSPIKGAKEVSHMLMNTALDEHTASSSNHKQSTSHETNYLESNGHDNVLKYRIPKLGLSNGKQVSIASGSSSLSEETSLKERSKIKSSKHEKRKSIESSDSDSSEVESKKHKKKHKKKKKKHKKRKHRESSSDDSSDDEKVEWIERTKESDERREKKPANHANNHSKNVSDLPSIKPRAYKEESLDVNKDIVHQLNNFPLRSFGEVKSWNGERSSLDTSKPSKYNQPHMSYKDNYNEEFDSGKVKKIKLKTDDRNGKYSHEYNPFQKMENEKIRSNGNTDYHDGYNGRHNGRNDDDNRDGNLYKSRVHNHHHPYHNHNHSNSHSQTHSHSKHHLNKNDRRR